MVVSLFIFDPRQGARSPHFSPNAFQFMIESLEDLAHQVTAARGRLSVFRGRPEAIVDRLVAEEDIEAVFINKDYTRFSAERETPDRESVPKQRCHVSLLFRHAAPQAN
jgi:deoxyribodipyrimidine photo-lyase